MSGESEKGVDRVTRTASLLTLGFAIGIAAQVDLIPNDWAVLTVWIVVGLALFQIVLGVVEHGRSLKELINA